MKFSSVRQVSALSLVCLGFVAACGAPSQPEASTQSLQDELEMARQVVVTCSKAPSAEDMLALELSKTCREQNKQLKASGVASCGEDLCTDMVTLDAQRRGVEFELGYDGEVEFLVTISSDFLSAPREKSGLICYSPVLKARELLGRLGSNCK